MIALFAFAAPRCAATTGPIISSPTFSPAAIPAVGAIVIVTARVTSSGGGVSSVILYENRPGGYNTPYRTAPMTVGSDGITYTATIQVDLNSNSQAFGESLYIEAKDNSNPANYTDTASVTQGYDNTAPTITNVTFGPDPIPVQGANVSVTASVTDTGVGLSTVTLYENRPGGYNTPYRTAPMYAGSDGVTYTATVPVDLNGSTGAVGENLYITATDKAGNQSTFNVSTQGYSSVPATGSLPVLVTADGSQPVLSPAFVTAGGGVLPVTIHGINFASGATVLFNGVQLPPASLTDSVIIVNVPPSLIAQAGSFAVSVVDPSPSGASNSVNLTVKANATSTTHILWNNTQDGRLSLWNYDILTGNYSQFTYGPYPNWSAKAVADGPDGKTRVLWDNTNGSMSLWSLDNTTGLFAQHSFGPYPGWTANSLSVSP